MYAIEEVLSPGTNTHLEFIDQQGYKYIIKTVVKQLDDTNLIMDLPFVPKALNGLPADSKITIVCRYTDEPRDFVFFTKFIEISRTNPPHLVLSIPVEFSLGREHFRCEVDLSFSYFNTKLEHKEGKVLNLSSNGLWAIVKSDEMLKTGMELPIKISLPDVANPPVIIAKIVRVVEGEAEYKLALSFPHLNFDLQDHITKFLYKTQQMANKHIQKSSFVKVQQD